MWTALALVALASVLWPDRPARLGLLQPAREVTEPRRSVDPRTRRAVLIGAALLAVSLLCLPDLLEIAVPVAVAVAVCSRRLSIKPTAERRSADRRQLAAICDLVATCLAAGMATGAALIAVLDQLAPATSKEHRPSASVTALRAVAALLVLGADPARAWSPADLVPELIPIVAAARRSTVGGVGLAQAVRDQATALGGEVADDLERRAGRAGVLMAAPLGLCFLPAFICLGLAPVIIALLADLGLG